MTNRNGLRLIEGDGDDREPVTTGPELDPAALDSVTRLLGQLERTARAQQPIVLYSAPPAPVAAPAASVAPVPVHIPGPPQNPPMVPEGGRLPRLFTRAEVALWSSVSVSVTGVAGMVADHVHRDGVAILSLSGLVCVLVCAACVVGSAKRYQGVEVVHGRIGRPRR